MKNKEKMVKQFLFSSFLIGISIFFYTIHTMFFYIHIPFCRQKCTYCKFALTPIFTEAKIEIYLAALKKEISEFFLSDPHRGGTIESIYFGGGTPSILSAKQIVEILEMFPYKQFSSNIEITIETNPEDVTEEWMDNIVGAQYFAPGFDPACCRKPLPSNIRISLGVQILNDMSLKEIGRSNSQSVYNALDVLEKGGICNVNADFILGLPFVSSGGTFQDIKTIHARYKNITHTSVYFLEKGLYPKHWAKHVPGEQEMCLEYEQICRFLKEEKGFHHYEISNFSEPGFESRHNQSYWNHSNYRGFGLSAASFVDGKRFENAHSFGEYYKHKRAQEEVLNSEQIRLERGMFGLRTFDLEEDLIENPIELSFCMEQGWIRDISIPGSKKKFSLTSAGIFIVDHIMSKLL